MEPKRGHAVLSPDVAHRLIAARAREHLYTPQPSIQDRLHNKSLIMLVGPAAVGKSFVMNYIVAHAPEFRRVPVLTTREARPDDEPGMFRYQPHTDSTLHTILDQIEARELVEYVIHPTSGRLYGTTIEDFPGEYNLLATLSDIVDYFRRLPFKQTYVIGLTTDLGTWQQWFEARYPHSSDERSKRLHEALLSLTWLLASERQSYITWVKNSPDTSEKAAQTIMTLVKQGDIHSDPRAQQAAHDMRAWAEEMVSSGESYGYL